MGDSNTKHLGSTFGINSASLHYRIAIFVYPTLLFRV